MAKRAAEGVTRAETVDDLDGDRLDGDLLVAAWCEDTALTELDDGEVDAEVEECLRGVGRRAIRDERNRLGPAADRNGGAAHRFPPPTAGFLVRAPEHRPVVEVVNGDRAA